MGWNKLYEVMEKSVVSVYNTGILDKAQLHLLMTPYIGADIEHGGCKGLRSNDGLSADEIVCKVMEPERFGEIALIPVRKYDSWLEALGDERECKIYELWREIARREWDIY